MMMIPIERPHGVYDIVVLLEDANIKRIKEHDPAEIAPYKLPLSFHRLRLRTIQLCYLSPSEAGDVAQGKCDAKEVVRKAFAGWKYKPEQGDHDGHYPVIVPPK